MVAAMGDIVSGVGKTVSGIFGGGDVSNSREQAAGSLTQAQQTANKLAAQSSELLSETKPLRTNLIQQLLEYLEGKDPLILPTFAPVRASIENQIGTAREGALASGVRGGQLNKFLLNLPLERAGMVANATHALRESLLGPTMNLATGFVPAALGGLSGATSGLLGSANRGFEQPAQDFSQSKDIFKGTTGAFGQLAGFFKK